MYIKFLNEESSKKANINVISDKVVQVEGVLPNQSGFKVYRDNGDFLGDYSKYTTLYRAEDGYFQLSNDGSVYEEGTPIQEPTLDELKTSKQAEIEEAKTTLLASGINIQLSSGKTEHFDLGDKEREMLMAKQMEVLAGIDKIPWHDSDPTKHCRYYSNADMSKIVSTILEHITYHETYSRDLQIYVSNLTTKEDVKSVTYGMTIPEDSRSEVLTDFMKSM